jgi:putative tricarboxylic transport membrane protein
MTIELSIPNRALIYFAAPFGSRGVLETQRAIALQALGRLGDCKSAFPCTGCPWPSWGAVADGSTARAKEGPMVNVQRFLASGALAALMSSVGGVTAAHKETFPSAQPALPALTIIAPAAPGGGWDQLAREMQRELERQALVRMVQVENVPGAAGTIGLAQFINGRRGDGGALLVNGLVMLGAVLWNQSPVSITQVTPIARLTGEYEVIAVPATSPHRDMQSLVRALRENPAAVSWGGGSAGGTDHILAGLIVAAANVDPGRTNYIAFSGGGEAVTALLGGQVTAGISGYSEFAQHIESGRLRAIGISSPRRLPDLDVSSLVEQGLDVELENWRAVVAPPGLDEGQRQTLAGVVERMAHSEAWRATLTRRRWTDSYLAGSAFDQFLDAERVRVGGIVSRMRGMSDDANVTRVGEWLFPVLVVGGSALVLTVLFVRRRAKTADPRANSGAAVRVALGLVSFVALLNLLGFVVAGTVLFISTAWAFSSRRWLRDALLGIALCAGVYVTFTYGLDVSLPPGLLMSGR